MPYTVHNFLVGQKFTAQAANEMDAQIAANTALAESYTPAMVDGCIADLRLDTDGENIILYYGSTEISEVAIQDVSSIIAAEALALTSGASLLLEVGGTSQITYTVSPSDATQRVRFLSNALSVANVSSAGLITALAVGVAAVSVKCGHYTATVAVTVKKTEQPVWQLGNWLLVPSSGNYMGMDTANYGRAICFPTEDYALRLKPGQTVTITPAQRCYVQLFAVIPVTAESRFGQDDNGRPRVWGGAPALVLDANNGNGVPYSYSATQDCYAAFMVGGGQSSGSAYTEQDAEDLNANGYVTVVVAPTPAQA